MLSAIPSFRGGDGSDLRMNLTVLAMGLSSGILFLSAMNLMLKDNKSSSKRRRRSHQSQATTSQSAGHYSSAPPVPGATSASIGIGLTTRQNRPRAAGGNGGSRRPILTPESLALPDLHILGTPSTTSASAATIDIINESLLHSNIPSSANDLHVWAIDESENLLNLIMSLAEEQTLADTIIHRSVTCNHCGMSPVRGWRFKCANCVDFDLCAGCESLDVHYKTHCFIKIRIPIPPQANPRSLIFEPFYPGIPWIGTPSFDTSKLEAETHFDSMEIMGFYEQFKSLSTIEGQDGGITKSTFEKCLGTLKKESQMIVDRIFSFFDQDGEGIISFESMVRGLSVLCKGTMEERVKYAFEGYDLDGDGYISRDELRKMFKSYFLLSMELVRGVVKVMEEGMLDTFDDEAEKPVSAAFGAPSTLTSNDHTIPNPNDARASALKEEQREEGESRFPTLVINERRGSLSSTAASPLSRTSHPTMDDDHLPLMESISHDAIEEMVVAVFEIGGGDGTLLSFSQFEEVVRRDPNVLAWIESLGSVF